jgi:hypothetical protein
VTNFKNDQEFLAQYLESIKFVYEHTSGFMGGVISPEYMPLYRASSSESMGANDNELARLLQTPQLIAFIDKVITSRKLVKFIAARSFADFGTKVFIVNYSPVINPATNNLVAIAIRGNPLDVFNLSSILSRYYKHADTQTYKFSENEISLTEHDKLVIFFFLLNFESQSIADLIGKIENKSISKNAIDQIFNKRLLPKFEVYSRKALYDKLQDLGFDRLMPQNVLNEGFFMEITDYVVFA